MGAPSSNPRANPAKPDVIGQSLSNMLLGAPPAPLGQTRASAPLLPPVGIGEGNEPIDLTTSGSVNRQVAEAELAAKLKALAAAEAPAPAAPSPAPTPAVPVAPAGSWIVQVGAAPTSDGASRLIAAATDKVDQLGDLRPYVERFDKGGQTYFRARFVGFGSEHAATGMCDKLKKAKLSCLAMQS
jgi:D-alanyl-D-alanine carboxypeptidase